MFTNNKKLKFKNKFKHTKNLKFVKWSFQSLETGWRDCWKLRNHTRKLPEWWKSGSAWVWGGFLSFSSQC